MNCIITKIHWLIKQNFQIFQIPYFYDSYNINHLMLAVLNLKPFPNVNVKFQF